VGILGFLGFLIFEVKILLFQVKFCKFVWIYWSC